MDPLFLASQDAERRRKEEERIKKEEFEARLKKREAYYANTPEARAQRQKDALTERLAQEAKKLRDIGNQTLPGPRVGKLPEGSTQAPVTSQLRASYLDFLKDYKEEETPVVTKQRAYVPPQEVAGLSSLEKGVDMEPFVKDFNSKYSKYGVYAKTGGMGVRISTTDGKKSMDIPGALGKLAGGSDALKKFISENSTVDIAGNLGFQEKAKLAKQQRPVARKNKDGSESTHMYSYAQVGGKFVAYPTLFPKSAESTSNPKDWMELDGDKAYSEAKRRGETIEFNDEASAKAFAAGAWKKAVDEGEELSRRVFKKMGLDNYDQVATAKRRQNQIEEDLSEINDYLEAGGPSAVIRAKYGKDIKAAKQRLIKERDELYDFTTSDKIREAIEESSAEQKRAVSRLRTQAKEEADRAREMLASINKYVKSKYGEDFVDPRTFEINKGVERILAKDPIEYSSVIRNLNVAYNTYKLASDKAFTEKTYLNATLDKYAQEKYTGAINSLYNSTMSSLKEGDMKRVMAKSLLADPTANPDDPALALELAKLAAKNVPSDISINQKRLNEAMETNNLEGIWDAISENPFEAVAGAVISSFAQVLPIMLDVIPMTTAAGAGIGAAFGGVPGALAGGVRGLTYGQAMSQFTLEVGDAMLSKAREKYDLTDTNQAAMALRDPEVIEAARTTGLARGGTIGAVDALTSALTSRLNLVKPLASRASRIGGTVLAKTAIDIPSEALGEALAQKAAGQQFSGAEVAMEGVGAFGMNTPTTAIAVYKQARGDYYADIADKMSKSPSFIRHMGEDLGSVVDWTNNMRQTGQINAATQQSILMNVSSVREARSMLSAANPNVTQRANQLFFGTGTKAEDRLALLIRAKNILSSNPTGNSATLSEIDNEINYTVQNKEVAPKSISVDLSSIVPQDTMYMLNGRFVLADEMENFIGSGKDGDKDLNESDVVIVGDDRLRSLLAEARNMGTGVNIDEYEDGETVTLSAETKDELPARFREKAKYNEKNKRWEAVTIKEDVKAAPDMGPITNVVSDEVYEAFQQDKTSVPEDVLNGIAVAMGQNKPLSARQQEIYQEYKDQIKEYEDLSGVISSSKAEMEAATRALTAKDKQVYAIDRRTGDRFAVSTEEELAKAGERGMKIIATTNKLSGAIAFSKRGSKMAADDVRTLKYAKDLINQLGVSKFNYQNAVELIAKAVENGADVDSAINIAINNLNKSVGAGKWNQGKFSMVMREITGTSIKKSAPTKDMRVDVNMGESMTKPKDVTYVKKVLSMLSKKFNADSKVINDPSIMKNGWVDYSGPKPTIYINTAYAAVDAPMHEYGHVFFDLIRENNLGLYQQILRETFGIGITDQKDFQSAYDNYLKSGKVSAPLFNYVDAKVQENRFSGLVDLFDGMSKEEIEVYNAVKNNTSEFDRPEVIREMSIVERLYPEYNTRQRDEEIIVRLLGQYATKELDERAKSYNAIKEFWEAIKTMLAQAIKMSIKDIGVSVNENLIRDTIVPNSTLQYIGMLMANPNLKFTDKIKTEFDASTQDQYLKQITDAYNDASARAKIMMLSPNASILAGQPNPKSWNMIVFEDRQKAIDSMDNMLSGVRTALSELESYMNDSNAVYRDLKDFVEKAGPLYDPKEDIYTNIQNSAFLDKTEFLRICKKVSDYIMDPSLERPSNIEMLIGLFGSDATTSNDKLSAFLAAFEIEKSLETGVPLQDEAFIRSFVSGLPAGFENSFTKIKESIKALNEDITNQKPEFHLWSMVSSSKESSLGRAASFFGATSGNFPVEAIREKGIDSGRTRTRARQQNREVKSANDGGDFLSSSLVTSPMMRNLNESFLSGIAYVHIPFSGDIEGKSLIRDSKKENFGSVQTGGAQFNLSGLAPNNALTMALGGPGEDFVGFLNANVEAQAKRMSATAAAPVGQRISKFTIDVPGRGPIEYKVEATRSKDGSVYVSFTAGGSYPMTGNAMQSMPMVAGEVLRMWAGTPVNKITFAVAAGGGKKRPGGEIRAGVYNLIARRMFGKYAVASADQYEIIIPDAFRPMVSLDNNAVKDMRVDGPGIVQNDAVNSTKYIIPMLKLLSKKFGTKYQIINDPSIMKNGWVDYNGAEPVIYVNMAYPTKDVAAHEYGHIFIDLLKVHNLTLYKDVVRDVFGGDRKEDITDNDYQEFKNTNKVSTSIFNGAQYLIAKGLPVDPRMQEMYDAVMNGTASTEKPLVDVERRYVAKNYPDLSIIEQDEEILVRLLGKLAADEFSKQSSLYETMMKFWRGIYDLIRSAIQLSVGDLAVPASMGSGVTLEFLAKALVNPRVVFTDRLKGLNTSTSKPNLPQWLTDMEDTYNRARLSAASKMQSPNSVISIMGTSSDMRGQVVVFEDKDEAISVAEEYNSNMNKLFDIAVDYMNNVTPEQIVMDHKNAMTQFSSQYDGNEVSLSRSGFLQSWYEDIQQEILLAFNGQGQMPDAFRIFALMVHPDNGGAAIYRFRGWQAINDVASGIYDMSAERGSIEGRIDQFNHILGEARDKFNFGHGNNPLHTASMIAATTTNSALAYQGMALGIRGQQPSGLDQGVAERTFKAPSPDNTNNFSDAPASMSFLRTYIDSLASRMSFVAIPVGPATGDIESPFVGSKQTIKTEPANSYLRTYILENEQGDWARNNSAALDGLVGETIVQAKNAISNASSTTSPSRIKEIMVQVPELKDKDTGVVTPAYVETYEVKTNLESNSFGQGIYLSFNVKGNSYLKLENAQQSMPSVIRAAISLWEGTPLTYIRFGISSMGKDSYHPDGTIKRTAAEQREAVYNFFGKKVAGKYYEKSGSGTTILIPETMRPVINNTNQGIKDSRVDLDLRNDGTGIMLNGTPAEEMAGQTLPPSFKEELVKTPAIFPDEYRASDVLDETHASGSRFIGIIKKWANGAIKYKKKIGGVSVERTFLVPFADKDVYSQLERLEREIDAKEGDVEAKTEEMNAIAKEYYQSTMLGMAQNLLAIFDSLTEEFKAKAKEWYVGANRTANFLSNKYGVSLEQSSAILAVFSPKKEWLNNIADAERFLDVMKNDYQTIFTKADADKVISKLTKGKVNSLKNRGKIEDTQLKNFAYLLNAHFKKYGEVSMEKMDQMGVSEEVQSQIVRGFMSLNYPKNTYGMFNPDGTFDKPSTTTYSENSYDNMGKAMRVYKDGSLQNIHQELGGYNKVRNFYNNIIDPYSPIPYVTADTHALSGALGVSVSADDASASGLFAEGFSSIYAMTKEAYIIAAQIAGYSPREMQSIIWEAVRTGINDKGRGAAQKERIFNTATQKNKKSRYERATETINENQSKNPEWGGGNIKIQVPEFLQGVRDRAKSRGREILLKWKQLRGRLGAASNMGGEPTPKSSANYAFLNSRGSIKRSMQVVRMLQKAFPDAVVFMSESDWNDMAPNLNIKANGAYGVTQNGKVYINPAVHKSDTDMFETVVHEFGHLWVNYIKTYNKALYNKGIALVMEEPDVISGKTSAEEMLADKIGKEGKSELLKSSEKFGTRNKFKNFLGELYDMLRNTFRFLRGMSDVEIASLTMDDFIGGALADLFSGKPIPESKEAFEATFSADPQFRETESVYDMVSRARLEGYKDSEIARMLEKNLPATPDRKDIIIDALRVMPFDLFNEFPDSFKNVPGGINLGKTMLTSVLDEVKKFAKKTVDGKKPTMAKVRQFALTELGKRDAFKDAPESLRAQMMMDLDSIVNITENKAIQNRMKEYAKKVRDMKKGARELTKIKKEMMSLIRAGLPKTMYTRSDVVTLLRKLNEATYANIKQVQDEVFEFITSIKVRDLKEKVKKQLDIATTKIEYNKRKGKSTIGLQDTMEFINQNIMDEKASPEQINERILKLQGIIDTESNPDIIAAAQMAMNYNRALMLEDNEFIKYQYLSDVSDFLKALINEDRAIFRQIMAESVAYYNNLKSAAFFDITGNAVDFGNAQEVEAAEDSLSGAQVEQSRNKFRSIMSKAASSLFVAFESIEGLVERISFAADEMFGGVLRSMITNRFDNARRTHDIYNAYASNMQTEKAIEIWGKGYRKALRENATKKYEIKLKDGNSIRMTMNQMYYIYNLYKDPSNYKALDSMKHFKGDINGLMGQINSYFSTPGGQKVKEWADWQVDELYPALYDIYNPVYMRIYRTRMPWNRYYAGRIYREGATQDVAPDLLGDRGSSFITYIGGESTKMRTAFNAPIYMDADGGRDGDSVMMAYLNDMNFFASHAEVIRDVDKVLKTKLIKDAIDVYASKDVYDALLEMIKSVQDVGFNYNRSDKLVTKITDSIYSKITRAKVALVPRISLTQFTSMVGFIPYIGPTAWSKYLIEAMNPVGPSYMKEIIDNSPTIAKRYDTNEITRMLSDFQAQRNALAGLNETQRISTVAQSFIRFGDKASLIGVLPNYLYYKKEFLKKSPGNEQGAINYALSKIEPQVDSVAQSSAAKDRSLAQNSSVYRYAFPFVSAPLALARREMHAIRNIFRILTGKKAKGTLVGNIGALAVYHILMPTLVTMAIKLPTILLGDWDEDDEDDVKAAAAFGNLYLLGIIPQVFYAMIEKLRGKPWADAVGQSIIAEELFSVTELILKLFNPDTMPLTSDDRAYIRQEGGDPEEFKGPIDEDKRREVAMKLILKSIDMKTGVGAENAGRFVKNINAIAEGEVEDVSDIFARLLNPPPSTFKGTGKYDKKRYTEDDLQYMKAENPELYQRIIDENRGKE